MITRDVYQGYFQRLLNGQRRACSDIVRELLEDGIEIRTLYLELFQKSLYEVGILWEANKITVAREHLATAITEGLMNLGYPYLFAGESRGKTAVISCAANEYHQIGGKMVADIFEVHGWDAHFLGANTPLEELLAFIDEVKPNLVGLSLSVYFNLPALKKAIEAVQANFKDLDLAVGGQAFAWGGRSVLDQYANLSYIPSLSELEAWLNPQ